MLQAAADLLRSVLLPESFRRNQNHQDSDFRNPIWNGDDDDDGDELYYNEDNMQGDIFHFHDALDFNLEKFMREFTKTFESNIDHFNKSFFQFPNDFSNLTPHPENKSTLRDSYLLPGYQAKSSNMNENVDSDVDGKVDPETLSKFFNNSSNNDQIIEKKQNFNNSPHFYAHTIITTTVTKPDGTVETKKIVRDHQGNEETTTITSHKNSTDDSLKMDHFSHDDFLNVWKQLFWK